MLVSEMDQPLLQAAGKQGPLPGFEFPVYATNSQQGQVGYESMITQGTDTRQQLNADIP